MQEDRLPCNLHLAGTIVLTGEVEVEATTTQSLVGQVQEDREGLADQIGEVHNCVDRMRKKAGQELSEEGALEGGGGGEKKRARRGQCFAEEVPEETASHEEKIPEKARGSASGRGWRVETARSK